MRTAAITIALLMSGAAVAQTYDPPATAPEQELDVDADVSVQPDGDLDVDADVDIQPDEPDTDTGITTTTDTGTSTTTTTTDTGTMTTHSTGTTLAMAPASGPVVQPGNTNPELDARGIAVISDPAFVPVGFNGVATAAVGGPDAEASRPACSATVTDNCDQTYERDGSDD